MMKYFVLVALFFAVTFSQTLCPATTFNKCEADIQKGMIFVDV